MNINQFTNELIECNVLVFYANFSQNLFKTTLNIDFKKFYFESRSIMVVFDDECFFVDVL